MEHKSFFRVNEVGKLSKKKKKKKENTPTKHNLGQRNVKQKTAALNVEGLDLPRVKETQTDPD
jgi:hypothetical protein